MLQHSMTDSELREKFETVRAFVAETVPIDEIEALALGLAFVSDDTKRQAVDLSRDDLMQKLTIAGAETTRDFERMAIVAFTQLVFERAAILEQAAWGRG